MIKLDNEILPRFANFIVADRIVSTKDQKYNHSLKINEINKPQYS